MSLSLGIVGLPNVGKSTLFNALVKNGHAQASNYPFTTIDPNVGIVEVPDPRLQVLADIVHPERIMPATIEFVDIAGIIKGASAGEGLGNQFLSNIRLASAIMLVARFFADEDVIHVHGKIDPKYDLETVLLELMLADLSTVQKGMDRYRKTARGGDKTATACLAFTEKLYAALEQEKLASTVAPEHDADLIVLRELQLLTAKPMIVVANVAEADLATPPAELFERFQLQSIIPDAHRLIPICAQIEAEVRGLSEEEQQEYLQEYGLKESGLDRLIRRSYDLLGLHNYFTAGPKEVRAWTVEKGTRAPQAAAVIHTDFEKAFIRAEVIAYADYAAYAGEQGAKEAGKFRLEGKEYVVQDGDVLHFRVNT